MLQLCTAASRLNQIQEDPVPHIFMISVGHLGLPSKSYIPTAIMHARALGLRACGFSNPSILNEGPCVLWFFCGLLPFSGLGPNVWVPFGVPKCGVFQCCGALTTNFTESISTKLMCRRARVWSAQPPVLTQCPHRGQKAGTGLYGGAEALILNQRSSERKRSRKQQE